MPCFDANKTVSAFIADTVLELMRKGGTGEVLMVNSAGVYLNACDQVWLLCDISWGAIPIGIAIEDFAENIKNLQIEQGQSFLYCENKMIFSGRELKLSCLPATSKAGSLEKPQPDLMRRAAQEIVDLHKVRGISMLALPLLLDDEKQDFVSLNPYCSRAYPLLLRLIKVLSCESDEDVRECVASLLGLGVGLTPSADDVMLGMLYTFRMLGNETPESVKVFRESIAEMCDTHTSKVSAAYLKAVLSGAHFERLERVFCGLCGAIPLDTSLLFEVGGSSGSEMLLGMLLALHICGYRTN